MCFSFKQTTLEPPLPQQTKKKKEKRYTRVNPIILPTTQHNVALWMGGKRILFIACSLFLFLSLRQTQTQTLVNDSHAGVQQQASQQQQQQKRQPLRVVVFLSIYGNLYVLDNLRKLFTRSRSSVTDTTG